MVSCSISRIVQLCHTTIFHLVLDFCYDENAYCWEVQFDAFGRFAISGKNRLSKASRYFLTSPGLHFLEGGSLCQQKVPDFIETLVSTLSKVEVASPNFGVYLNVYATYQSRTMSYWHKLTLASILWAIVDNPQKEERAIDVSNYWTIDSFARLAFSYNRNNPD